MSEEQIRKEFPIYDCELIILTTFFLSDSRLTMIQWMNDTKLVIIY